jgi:hypothetical protein
MRFRDAAVESEPTYHDTGTTLLTTLADFMMQGAVDVNPFMSTDLPNVEGHSTFPARQAWSIKGVNW